MKKKYTYLEWLSPEEMHEASLQWFSELNFARDEQLFLNNLVNSYTVQLTEKDVFAESKEIVTALLHKEKEIVGLMKRVQAHENQLEIMVDDVDQFKMEKAYIETHRELIHAIDEYMQQYRPVKERLFKLVSKILKKGKQKRLLN
ncbi:hypothetical protein SAMN04487911_12163 [Arenibacter nanhaiticus]|uniref:Uncharacterized protein n=1 Tax=Arenibacter nanhaiticus TaxID=558155 RepID=A0A1M6JDE3_9FLAO|nr:hypothetical protein [Arenibacter nanhaiticus]SHJ44746.1 hypothetical protein SAMN04487911_12163 [Arenibacter nanhaiticus]